MKRLFSHPNIIRYYGNIKKWEVCIEYMELGALKNFLFNNQELIGQEEKVKMCLQISKGMDYISSLNIVHCDLAIRNVLVSKNLEENTDKYVLKICDFGLSSFLPTGKDYFIDEEKKVSPRWCSPEILKERRFSKSSDVWAFGIVIWEIFTNGGFSPFWKFQNENGEEDIKKNITEKNVVDLLDFPLECPKNIKHLADNCFKKDPKERPSFQHIIEELNVILKEKKFGLEVVFEWSCQEFFKYVSKVLDLSYGDDIGEFIIDNQIDGKRLKTITETNLKEMGMVIGDRKTLIHILDTIEKNK